MKHLHRLLKTLAVTDGRGSELKIKLYPPIDSIGPSVKERTCIGE